MTDSDVARVLLRFEGAINLMYPDDMTPAAKRMLAVIVKDERDALAAADEVSPRGYPSDEQIEQVAANAYERHQVLRSDWSERWADADPKVKEGYLKVTREWADKFAEVGAADEVSPPQDNQRDLLGQALGELLVAMGVVNDVPLTGPELLCAARTAIDAYPSRRKELRDALSKFDLRQEGPS